MSQKTKRIIAATIAVLLILAMVLSSISVFIFGGM